MEGNHITEPKKKRSEQYISNFAKATVSLRLEIEALMVLR